MTAYRFAVETKRNASVHVPLRRSRMKPLLSALLLVLLALPSLADDDQAFRQDVDVNYVIVPFTALGAKGIPMTDIQEREVSLYVDNFPVPLDMFELSMNAPVSWTILFDASGSMGLAGKMDAAKAAINSLISRRYEGDDFALYVFDSKRTARELVPYTENPAALTRALETVKPWGKTAFYDALAQMPERSELGRNASRAILLLSDGIDNASRLTSADIEKLMEGTATPIYAFALREPGELNAQGAKSMAPTDNPEMGVNLDLLEELARTTGGQIFVGNRPDQLQTAMDSIAKVMRAQYLVGFEPTGKGGVRYRRILLKLSRRTQGLRVRAGYRGTEPPPMNASSRKKSKRTERKKG